jgi:hypothetical protein
MGNHHFGVFLMLAVVGHVLTERGIAAAYRRFAPAFVAQLEATPGSSRRYFAFAVGVCVTLVTSPWFAWLAFHGATGTSPLHGWTAAAMAPVAIRAAQFIRETDSLREYRTMMVSQIGPGTAASSVPMASTLHMSRPGVADVM